MKKLLTTLLCVAALALGQQDKPKDEHWGSTNTDDVFPYSLPNSVIVCVTQDCKTAADYQAIYHVGKREVVFTLENRVYLPFGKWRVFDVHTSVDNPERHVVKNGSYLDFCFTAYGVHHPYDADDDEYDCDSIVRVHESGMFSVSSYTATGVGIDNTHFHTFRAALDFAQWLYDVTASDEVPASVKADLNQQEQEKTAL